MKRVEVVNEGWKPITSEEYVDLLWEICRKNLEKTYDTSKLSKEEQDTLIVNILFEGSSVVARDNNRASYIDETLLSIRNNG